MHAGRLVRVRVIACRDSVPRPVSRP